VSSNWACKCVVDLVAEQTLANQNSVQEEIKSRMKPEDVCHHSVQNLLSSSLLSKNMKIKICRTIIFSVVLHGCETWPLILRLRVPENKALKTR
jgi:hypothetical protein